MLLCSCEVQSISIHALREEGDQGREVHSNGYEVFLSTPSARRATRVDSAAGRRVPISIHALREEGDGLICLCPILSI